ncbi:MAG: radical SAM family heme chaperone HemW [Synergistaceae bacterium]|nr:radical SAM family heme chaperone HemW [Synergistaceae bacterium]
MAAITSLYIHVPFCQGKCHYCSFYSLAGHEDYIDSWLDALDIEAARYYRDSKIALRTLYVGGGTPSVLSLTQWQKLIHIITKYFSLDELQEATSEANPNSLTHDLIKFLEANYFTRLSLGVQSLNDSELRTLGRLHDSRLALNAMELVRASRLTLSCDLIFAIPGQTLRTWADSLKKIIEFAEHVSTYQLTLEPETPLASKYDNEDLNESGYKFYRYAQYYLPLKNFTQYEISNFAPEKKECLHNLAYWSHDEVIALGPSAVSYINNERIKNPSSLQEYFYLAKNNFPDELLPHERLTPHERAIELAILNLRTKWGINRRELLPEVERVISQLPEDLFIITPERIALSKRGMRLGNSIWSEIIDL